MVYILGAHLRGHLPPIQGNSFLQLQQGSWLVLITEKSLHRTPHQFNRVEVWALGRTPPPMPLEFPRAALQDISWRSNVAATPGEFVIPPEDVAVAAQSCRSRRNLAARLATAIFPPHERAGSNCCGVLGKTALNGLKVKAIYTTSLQHFPLQRRKTCATLLTTCVVRRRLWLCRDLKKTFPNADY